MYIDAPPKINRYSARPKRRSVALACCSPSEQGIGIVPGNTSDLGYLGSRFSKAVHRAQKQVQAVVKAVAPPAVIKKIVSIAPVPVPKQVTQIVNKADAVTQKVMTRADTTVNQLQTAISQNSPPTSWQDIQADIRKPSLAIKDMEATVRNVTHVLDTNVGQYVDRGAKWRVDFYKTKDDIKSVQDQLNAALRAVPVDQDLVASLQARLQQLGGKMKSMMGEAKVVLTIASIVAGFFTGGTATVAMQSAMQIMKQGLVELAKKKIIDLVMNLIGKKLSQRLAKKYAQDVADFTASSGQMPGQADYERLLNQYVNEGLQNNEAVAPVTVDGIALPAPNDETQATLAAQQVIKNASKPSNGLLPILSIASLLFF